MSIDRITDVLTEHGWPPATLIVVILLAVALYVMYRDHREMEGRWQELAQANLEANLMATNQRKGLQKMLETGIATQEKHLRMIGEMDQARLRQNQLDQQLTGAAIQALRQIADKVDVQLQVDRPHQVLDTQQPRK